jgi:hypothetical protein
MSKPFQDPDGISERIEEHDPFKPTLIAMGPTLEGDVLTTARLEGTGVVSYYVNRFDIIDGEN